MLGYAYIRAGMEFKGFGELCEAVGVSYSKTSTCSQKAIEKKFKQYFSWEKTGRYSQLFSFIINRLELC